MKKFGIISAAFLLMGMLFGSQAMAQGQIDFRTNSAQQCANVSQDGFTATFSFSGIQATEITNEKGTFSEIKMDGTYPSGNVGEPSLPAANQLIAVPFGAKNVTVQVKNFSTTTYRLADYGIKTVMPQQASVSKSQKPEDVKFAYSEKAYAAKSMSQRPIATLEMKGTMRGIQVGSLTINPVNYNPATNTIEVYNDIEVEVRYNDYDKSAAYNEFARTFSPYFASIYKTMFNWRDDVYDQHPDLWQAPVRMLVIADRMFEEIMQEWIEWKTMKGFYMNVKYTDEIGTSAAAIRSFIQDEYSKEAPTFLIIFGDKNQVSASATGSETHCVTDLQYSSVDGDQYPDMYHSRLSAETTAQLANMLNKALEYEQYTMPDPSYLSNVTLIAGWDSYWNPRIGQPTINYATTYYYNTAHGFNQVNTYLQQGQYTGCYNTLNTGVGFINYTAHGAETSWSDPYFTVSNVNALTNTNKYFLAMGNCCLTGNFGYSQPCFGEAMLRGENKAAYSYIGSCPVTYWYEDYYFGVGATTVMNQTPTQQNSATGVYDGIWMDDTYNTVSSITFLGNIAVCYAHAGNYQTSTPPLYYWQAYHVLGDGSIMPYRVNPTPNTVSHASTIPAGATSFQVNAQAGSYVGISQNNVLKGAALVPASGSVSVPVSGISSGQVHIVVTKPQRQPYIQDITVGGAPQSYTINVSANPSNGGTVTGGGSYNQGQSCTVTATANNGFSFTNWTENGNVVSTQANYTFTVTGNRTLVANFQAQQQNYTITVSANPSNGGTVTGGGSYQQGQQCTVQATANTGYTFTNWTENGNVVSNNANYTFTVTGNRTLVANFTQQQFTITATANPSNGGTVTGSGAYNYGQSCTLSASPATGYTFLRWTKNGTQVSTNATYTFVVTESATYVAQFQAQSYYVATNSNPSNGGTTSGNGLYSYGETCTVTATPATGYDFVNWTENGNAISTEASYSFTVTGGHNLIANFTLQAFEINAIVNPVAGGTTTGSGTYHYGDRVTVCVETNEDYAFENWTENGEVVSVEKEYTFIATESRNLIANLQHTVGLGEQGIHALVIYPNPVNDKLTVMAEDALGTVEIYNLMGALVYSQKGSSNKVEINTTDLPTGVYFIRLTTDQVSETRRFVKE